MLANLVEFPAVPKGQARFRLQVMAGHSQHDIVDAVHRLSTAVADAAGDLAALENGVGRRFASSQAIGRWSQPAKRDATCPASRRQASIPPQLQTALRDLTPTRARVRREKAKDEMRNHTFALASAACSALPGSRPQPPRKPATCSCRRAVARTKLIDKGEICVNGTLDPNADYATREAYHSTLGGYSVDR